MSLDKLLINVVDNAISHTNILLRDLENGGAQGIRLLTLGTNGVVVSREGVEISQSHPSSAELFSGGAIETADIGTHQRNTEHLEVEDSGDGQFEISPGGSIVTQPMTSVHSMTREGTSANNHGSFTFNLGEILVGGFGFHESKHGVDVVFHVQITTIVGGSHVNVLLVQRGDTRDILRFNAGRLVWVNSRTFAIAEIACFIHIEPQSGETDGVFQDSQHLAPVLGGRWMEPVRESSETGPNLSNKGISRALISLDEDVHVDSGVISEVVLTGDTSVKNGDIMTTLRFHLIDEVQEILMGESVRIQGEVVILVHIIDISPESIDRQVVRDILIQHGLPDGEIMITPSTLMPAQSPERNKGGFADQCLVLLDHFHGSRTHENVHLEDTTDRMESQRVISDVDVLGVGVSEEDTMVVSGVDSVFHVERMVTVQVFPGGHSIIVRSTGVVGKSDVPVIFSAQSELMDSLTHTIEIRVVGHGGGYLNELISEVEILLGTNF
mmetsp:Transcript_1721/g.1828  ORF Transcript_1721/g.1828 Transcript_1721/m.1828 type:complete len:497 (+) Transcript_1721:923-2413(+)